ncbi:selenocysteine-specific translation elongation factor [Salinibacillus xinjiangensis]|uniref:Selenocysteine-specific elongation factor n=1 Tax=Salinibacillus xinjiangensis TaxID=1229268 RepID=A0A6G1X320_9BACI|nr:selenocysteine-specific translation elongation factor [Salinibacillus xinjiangensis]MRG85295.1 selenocysteine-specific translation elongation factor [Salinibacillus xinjiangensis]
MAGKNYTIGMAGHIDHGKTSLTKALTNIDTDRLKEEKERNISIELGFAPLKLKGANFHVSIIDVPGHERFIRQMIAGVAGIDLVIITIAADEGIMPQTKEHIDILSLLQVERAIIAITKVDKADEELLELVIDDVRQYMKDTHFHDAPMLCVDSLSEKGIPELEEQIVKELEQTPIRNAKNPFRMPIDQVFTLKGVGTIVRGTIYDGAIQKGEPFYVLPGQQMGKARQLQVHHEEVNAASAGQRAAINVVGIDREELERGDVFVKNPKYFDQSDTIDVSLKLLNDIQTPIKQRAPIKLHTGANEVYGKIVFFDRNKVQQDSNEILCQIRLQKPIVVNRGDRFILRRATPVETLGGGWIINPVGEKYKFGPKTIEQLQQVKEGSPETLVKQLLNEEKWLERHELIRKLSLDEATIDQLLHDLEQLGEVVYVHQHYATAITLETLWNDIETRLTEFHQEHPLKEGMNKPELLQLYDGPKKVIEELLNQWLKDKQLKQSQQYLSLYTFTPHLPSQWKKRMGNVLEQMKLDQIQVKEWEEYVLNESIPAELANDFKAYVIREKSAYPLSEKHVINAQVFLEKVKELSEQTDEYFTLSDAKDVWGVSRKYLIPLLELLDELQYTERVDRDRRWLCRPN